MWLAFHSNRLLREIVGRIRRGSRRRIVGREVVYHSVMWIVLERRGVEVLLNSVYGRWWRISHSDTVLVAHGRTVRLPRVRSY